MSTITTRAGKGSPLTNNEVDANFTNLNTDKAELSGAAFTGNITFTDNSKAIFGAGSDLEIFHEPNNSIIKESGGGSLLIQGDNIRLQKVDGSENMLTAVNDGQLKLFYDGAEKLATTSTGIDVTGTIASSSNLEITSSVPKIILTDSNNPSGQMEMRGANTEFVFDFDPANAENNSQIDFKTDGSRRLLIKSTGIDVTGTATMDGLVVDNITIDGNEIDVSSGDLTLDVAGDIILDADGGSVFFKDAGTEFFKIRNTGSDVQIYSARPDADMKFEGVDGSVGITALRLDMSAAGAATFNSTIAATSADLRNTSSGAETTALSLRNFAAGANTATALNFYPTQSTARFASIVAENTDGNNNIALSFLTSAGDTPSAALTLNQDRTATFSSTIASAGVTSSNSITMTAGNMSLNSTSDGNQAFRYYRADGTLVVQQYPYNNRFNVQTYNNQGLRLKSDGSGQIELEGNVVINEDSADVDFRVESNNNANMLFVDGGNNRVGIGTSSIDSNAKLQIEDSTNPNINIDRTSSLLTGNHLGYINFQNNGAVYGYMGAWVESASGTDGKLAFGTRNGTSVVDRLTIASDGAATFTGNLVIPSQIIHAGDTSNYMQFHQANGWRIVNSTGERFHIEGASVVFNHDGHDADFRVESNGYSHMLFVDAGADIVAFGQTQNISSGGMYFNHSNATKSHLVVSNTETSYSESLYYGNRQNSDGQVFQFRRQNYTVGSVSVTSSGTTYNTTSDRRLKKDIKTITDGTDKLMAMNPVTHGWKADPEAGAVHGFIAQEMMDIVPEAVSGDPEGEEMMSMDYGRITPVIVAALQDALTKIETLETRLTALENA